MEKWNSKNPSFIRGILRGMLAATLLVSVSGCEDYEDYLGDYTEESQAQSYTEVADGEASQLVEQLSSSGSSLVDGYEGDYGKWGVEVEGNTTREHYTKVDQTESVTIMVYMIGSNLESEGGAATADLQEMLNSKNGANVNLVVETGGATQWQNQVMDPDYLERWLIQDGQLQRLDQLERTSMADESTLTDFITWTASAYPSERYMLVLWDHGGGPMGGYGSDEFDPQHGLNLSQLQRAVKNSGIQLDLISFDACLMGTLEVGYAFEPYADYLLASEESEPGDGYYYTDALAALSENPTMSTVEFGARMIDGFTSFYQQQGDQYPNTLSLMDLAEVGSLYQATKDYYENVSSSLKSSNDSFRNLSSARSHARSYGENKFEQIDLVDFVQRSNLEGAEEVIRAAFSAVKYRNDTELTGSYGTAIYFPYQEPQYYSTVKSDLKAVNYTLDDVFYDQFVSILAGGSGGNSGGISSLTGYDSETQDYSGESWYDSTASEDTDYTTVSEELQLEYDEDMDVYTLTLPDSQWDSITDIELQVMLDDGEGYIDLGSDQIFAFDDQGRLVVDFDGTWVSINDEVVEFYALPAEIHDDDSVVFTGYVPMVLNGETMINLYLQWNQDPDGNTTSSVLGYLKQEEGSLRPKGYLKLKKGDVLQPLCTYYTYDGNLDNQYLFGDEIEVKSQKSLKVDWFDLGSSTVIVWMKLTDVYQQAWYTETVEIQYE